jgi:hypothetical protein
MTARKRSSRGPGPPESRDYSCTLLVALVDGASAAFFQIGDRAIVYGTAGAATHLPSGQSGEYANCTFFVTDGAAADRCRRPGPGASTGRALSGLQARPALRLREFHAPFFEPMFARLRSDVGPAVERLDHELRAFLDSRAVSQRTDDDRRWSGDDSVRPRLRAPGAGEVTTMRPLQDLQGKETTLAAAWAAV